MGSTLIWWGTTCNRDGSIRHLVGIHKSLNPLDGSSRHVMPRYSVFLRRRAYGQTYKP